MMTELESVLRAHAEAYPRMQPTDGVKLIYQNEFGGGHMIRDEAGCLEYLRQEYARTEKDRKLPSYEAIGNGMIRVHLAAVAEEDLEALGLAFIRSAGRHRGDLPRFLEKLDVLRDLTRQGVFSFSSETLEDYLTAYRAAGCPVVSHSPEYRESYHPAYRVLFREEYLPE